MPSDPREVLLQAIAERNDARGKGGAAQVARELGCTPSLVSQLAGGTYRSPEKWYQLILEKYSPDSVSCPILGEIPLQRCKDESDRPYSMANPIRGELSRTCPWCGCKPNR